MPNEEMKYEIDEGAYTVPSWRTFLDCSLDANSKMISTDAHSNAWPGPINVHHLVYVHILDTPIDEALNC